MSNNQLNYRKQKKKKSKPVKAVTSGFFEGDLWFNRSYHPGSESVQSDFIIRLGVNKCVLGWLVTSWLVCIFSHQLQTVYNTRHHHQRRKRSCSSRLHFLLVNFRWYTYIHLSTCIYFVYHSGKPIYIDFFCQNASTIA